jgi:DNA polymerase III epsilon subunit-like protein
VGSPHRPRRVDARRRLERLGTDCGCSTAPSTRPTSRCTSRRTARLRSRLPGHLSLDSLADLFGVIPHDRHTASGDAFITALVFLRLLKLASRHGRTSLVSICQEFVLPE